MLFRTSKLLRKATAATSSAAIQSPYYGKRIYHFFINERGNLYHMYDIKPALPALKRVADNSLDRVGLPSGPAHIRDNAFINFFIKNLYFNKNDVNVRSTVPESSTTDLPKSSSVTASSSGYFDEADIPMLTDPKVFPFISYCGKEVNFVACEKQPIVFHTLVIATGEGADSKLVFAGNLEEPFQPSNLRVDKDGYLYHSISAFNDLRTRKGLSRPSIGLVGADVGLKLGFEFIDEGSSEGSYVISWNGKTINIPALEGTN